MRKRLHDRIGLRKRAKNFHFDYMAKNIPGLYVKPEALHYDDRKSDLNLSEIFSWPTVYGTYEQLCEQLEEESSSQRESDG